MLKEGSLRYYDMMEYISKRKKKLKYFGIPRFKELWWTPSKVICEQIISVLENIEHEYIMKESLEVIFESSEEAQSFLKEFKYVCKLEAKRLLSNALKEMVWKQLDRHNRKHFIPFRIN